MDKAPAEVNDLIVRSLEQTTDLKNMRLVSKDFSVPATKELFSHLTILLSEFKRDEDPDEDPVEDSEDEGHEEYNPEAFPNLQAIASSSELAPQIRSVRIITNLEPNKTKDDYNNDKHINKLSRQGKEAIELVKNFGGLEHVTVEFGAVCSFHTPEDWWMMDAEDSFSYRNAILNVLFKTLNDKKVPAANLKSLALKNLQDKNDPTLLKSKDFLDVIGRVKELRLKIVTEYNEASPESSAQHACLHEFFAELPSLWLEPAQNLTSLTLHADIYWGYMPRCDLRSVFLPKLKKLEMGNWTITHDWQMDWILKHSETLEELVLDDCPIISYIRNFGPLDIEQYPVDGASDTGDASNWQYDGMWAENFKKLAAGLPELRKFVLGTGEWEDGINFEDRGAGVNEDMGGSYKAFNRGIGPSPWLDVHEYSDAVLEEVEEEDEDDEESVDIEKSDTETKDVRDANDAAAYESLMEVVRMRAARS